MNKNDVCMFIEHITELLLKYNLTGNQMWYVLMTWLSFHADTKYLSLYYNI
jgi:hypothetical protein